MSGNQQSPDMICEVFVLAPTDLVADTLLVPCGTLGTSVLVDPAAAALPPAGEPPR